MARFFSLSFRASSIFHLVEDGTPSRNLLFNQLEQVSRPRKIIRPADNLAAFEMTWKLIRKHENP